MPVTQNGPGTGTTEFRRQVQYKPAGGSREVFTTVICFPLQGEEGIRASQAARKQENTIIYCIFSGGFNQGSVLCPVQSTAQCGSGSFAWLPWKLVPKIRAFPKSPKTSTIRCWKPYKPRPGWITASRPWIAG